MSLKITHKYSTAAGTPPASGDIDVGEVAINAADAELYTKDNAGNIRKFQNTTTGTADGVQFTQAGTGAVQRTVESKLKDVVSVKDFGAVGDGVTDDTAAIQAALVAVASGGVLDLENKTYALLSSLYQSFSGNVELKNGKLLYTGLGSEYLLRLLPAKTLTLSNLEVDGANLAAKLVYVTPTTADSRVYAANCVFKNGLQTDTITSFSVGLQISANSSSVPVETACVTACHFENFTSTKADTGTGSTVGRGLLVSDCLDSNVDSSVFKNIGPYQDGDGCVFTATGDPARVVQRAIVDNCSFENCHKRSIKSQVSNTIVSDSTFKRSQAYTDNGSGQAEIDLQYGGRISNIECRYGDGCAPVNIVGISSFGDTDRQTLTGVLSGINIIADDPTDIIRSVFQLNRIDAGAVVVRGLAESISVNCLVRNIAYVYGKEGGTSSSYTTDLTLREVSVAGFSTETEAAIVFLTRGSTDTFTTNIYFDQLRNDGDRPAAVYKDPAPGTTSLLVYSLKESQSFPHIEALGESVKVLSPAFSYNRFVSEDAAVTLTFPVLSGFYTAVKVDVFFTSSRTSAFNKLYTSGVISAFSTGTYYAETVAGVKSSAACGSIAVAGDGSNLQFTVSKTAGSLSSTGVLCVVITGAGQIGDPIIS